MKNGQKRLETAQNEPRGHGDVAAGTCGESEGRLGRLARGDQEGLRRFSMDFGEIFERFRPFFLLFEGSRACLWPENALNLQGTWPQMALNGLKPTKSLGFRRLLRDVSRLLRLLSLGAEDMVQVGAERKVRDLERRLDVLKSEAEALRRKCEELRT